MLQGGKKYVLYSNVFTNASVERSMGGVNETYTVEAAPGTPNISSTTKIAEWNALDVRGTWRLIETRIETGAFAGNQATEFLTVINSTDPSITSGGVPKEAYVDNFFIYEYVDVVVPEYDCTLELNVAGSVVVDSTGANGSITIAITGGTGPFEYSKDNGATWQGSNVFAGLAPGAYPCIVREVDHPTCEGSYSFVVDNIYGGGGSEVFFTYIVTHETTYGANNGRIELIPTGGTAPFEYSIAYPNFYNTNVFDLLAPGTYNVIVRDVNGYLRGAAITVNAGTVIFVKGYLSKNHIPFSSNAPANWASLTNYRKYCEVVVEDVAGSSTFNSKIIQEIYPASNGQCIFNLRQALRNVFTLSPPSNQDSSLRKLTDRVKLFKIKTGDLQDYEETPGAFATSLPYLALYGGITMADHARIDFFSYLAANKKFLSWAPLTKWVEKGQEDYLNFYVYNALITQVKLRLKTYFDDDTNVTTTVKTLAGLIYGNVVRVPAGPTNSGAAAIDVNKVLVMYELTLLDQANAVISETRTYMVRQTAHPLRKYIMIVNSLGAHEVHSLNGQAETKHKIDRDVIQKYLPPTYSYLAGQLANSESTYRAITSYSTGYIPGPFAAQWKEYLTDILLTRFFFDVTTGIRYPMIITSDDIMAKEDRQYENFVRFEAAEAYQNPGFNPKF